jgi:hypothetical protein
MPYTYGELPPPVGPLVIGPESSVDWQQVLAAEVAALYRSAK